MKILLIEDDQNTSELISATLFSHHYAVDTIADGVTGLEMAAQWHYDLILLDILLPKLNGLEVCRRLRDRGCPTPILILTTQATNADVIAGLDAGADDYLAKSCDALHLQLLARVRALLRRGGNTTPSPVLTWSWLCLDPAAARVTYKGEEVALRPKEYALLELFLRQPHRILSRGCIIDHLWSMAATPVEGSITNLIKDLRQRLKAAGMLDDLIETVYGLGYRLKTAPTPQDEALDCSADTPTLPRTAVIDCQDWKLREQRGQARIQRATERFQGSLQQRIAVLEAVERSLQAGSLGLEQCQAAHAEAHKLAGGLGTFGDAAASQIARSIEDLLAATLQQETLLIHQLPQLLEQLKQELTKPLTNTTTA